nr:replication protein A 70 kDa DNA-binding subunit B-like [Ipomoea batatas]
MITLWDEHVNSVLPFYNAVLTDPLIVILQLCRARVTDDGEVRISSSYTTTKVLFNYECLSFSLSRGGREAGEFWVVGEIIDIERDWYFIAVVIVVLDDDQDGQLLLWDNVCSSLLGVIASELKEKEGCMPNEIDGLVGKTLKFRIVTRHDQFNYRGNVAFTVLGVKDDEAIAKSVKKGEEGSVVRKLADAK